MVTPPSIDAHVRLDTHPTDPSAVIATLTAPKPTSPTWAWQPEADQHVEAEVFGGIADAKCNAPVVSRRPRRRVMLAGERPVA
ncbi:hypothetical protein ACFVJH_33795 [Streptomyces decoyicus]|uniref:hypothetical protein n=1 Tax=Streptomyces decoyicus TaxID=249567 RepID=UPI00363BEBBB